ncbi:MAG: hypothetical protein HN348_06700 [Proteobacteria bacterium]|nr:hypothetical protein [Pseudomonadota bacterium]
MFFVPNAWSYDAIVLGAPSIEEWNNDVRDKIRCTGFFDQVDVLNVGLQTPTLLDLNYYDAVLVYSEVPFDAPTTLGNVLADFVDSGGGVVVATATCTPNSSISGRFVTDGYLPWTLGPLSMPGGSLEFIPDPTFVGHEALRGLNVFDGGDGSIQCAHINTDNDAKILATWENGEPFVVVREDESQNRVVGLNFFPPSSDMDADFWSGDGDWAMTAALLYSLGFEYPYTITCWQDILDQDLNCNGIDESFESPVDTADPQCRENIDTANEKYYSNVDYYHDYKSFGCKYYVGEMDVDGDLFNNDVVEIQDTASLFSSRTHHLACDNCKYDYNPLQEDLDCDNVGDLCDNCVTLYNPTQENGAICWPEKEEPMQDCWGDVCDICPCDYDPDQADTDGDELGDACDNCPNVWEDSWD